MKTLSAVLLLGLTGLQPVQAHEEEAVEVKAPRQAPQHLADGRIFLPKSSQRLLLRSAELRERIVIRTRPRLPACTAVDRRRSGWSWLRRHPAAVPVTVFMALPAA